MKCGNGEMKTAHVHKHNLKIMYTNVDSLLNKRVELQAHIVQHAPDVICITEVVPKNTSLSVQDVELQLENFDLFSNVHSCKRGVLIYTKKSLQASPSNVEKFCDFEESCWCEVSLEGVDHLLIGCIYRSPNSDIHNNAKLNTSLRKVCESAIASHILICGDFNYPEIEWIDETTPANPHHPATLFMECLRDCFLFQHVKIPTHHRQDQTANVLDLVMTNEEGMVEGMECNAPIRKSDHATLTFTFKCYTARQKPKVKKFKFDKGNYNEMREEMRRYNGRRRQVG